MGSELHGKNRKNGNFHLNVYEHDMLRWLAFGFKQKFGVYAPLSKEDCKTLAKVLHNKAHFFEMIKDDDNNHDRKVFRLEIEIWGNQEDFRKQETIDWIHKVADWFDNCSGLIPEKGEKGED